MILISISREGDSGETPFRGTGRHVATDIFLRAANAITMTKSMEHGRSGVAGALFFSEIQDARYAWSDFPFSAQSAPRISGFYSVEAKRSGWPGRPSFCG